MNTQTQPQHIPNTNHSLVAIRIVVDIERVSVEPDASPIVAWQVRGDGCDPVTARWGLIDQTTWTTLWQGGGECIVTCELTTGKTWGPASRNGAQAYASVEDCAKHLAQMIFDRRGQLTQQGAQQ
jgi:hypothetical protein